MDRQDITQLYENYAQDVFRLALSYLHNRQDAEDICHTVFLNLLHKPVHLLPEKEKSFLMTCTANACKNHLKSISHKSIQSLDETVTASPEPGLELWTALSSLLPKDRAMIHLYYYEGYSQGEIAQIMKMSRTAVQTRMSRAREKLKKELIQDV